VLRDNGECQRRRTEHGHRPDGSSRGGLPAKLAEEVCRDVRGALGVGQLDPGGATVRSPDRGRGVARLDELCRANPLEVTASRRHDWFRTTGRHGAWVIPDWQAVEGEWDAVHLSVAAYLALAGRAIEVDGERASVIAGWSPDTTWWLTEPPTSDVPPQNWHRADPQAPWSRRA